MRYIDFYSAIKHSRLSFLGRTWTIDQMQWLTGLSAKVLARYSQIKEQVRLDLVRQLLEKSGPTLVRPLK